MNILYIGDIMGQPGIDVVEKILPDLKKEYELDLVIAQAENVTDGKGMSVADMRRLQDIGINFFTGGNHTVYRPEIFPLLENSSEPVIRPANMLNLPGRGFKYINTKAGQVLVISLLGKIVGKDADKPIDNPLKVVDQILLSQKTIPRQATIVNFHGDFSSEKRVIGYYLDGRVTAVIGDHWHVPTADAMVLPKGTAHITDVGMCGSMHSSLGVKTDIIINRWRDGRVSRNELETAGPMQFNAVLIKTDLNTNLVTSVESIQNTL